VGIQDYAHWNEEASLIWWLEEGRHPYEPEFSDFDDDPRDDWDDWEDVD